MSSESRIWEIRPFGSMRGGKELVIGRVPFNPSFPAYSTKHKKRGFTEANKDNEERLFNTDLWLSFSAFSSLCPLFSPVERVCNSWKCADAPLRSLRSLL